MPGDIDYYVDQTDGVFWAYRTKSFNAEFMIISLLNHWLNVRFNTLRI